MGDKNYLKGKRVLIVDDEADILDTLEDLLSGCEVVRATDYKEAKNLLENEFFDIAVLDIMGVDGYQLLDIAKNNEVIAAMLTANALSTEDTVKSFKEGAASYIPKDEMFNILGYTIDGVNVWVLFKVFFIMPLSGLYAWYLTRLMHRYRIDADTPQTAVQEG